MPHDTDFADAHAAIGRMRNCSTVTGVGRMPTSCMDSARNVG